MTMPIGPKRMSIREHLGELRRRLVVVAVCLLVATIVIYFFSPQLVTFLLDPVSRYLPGEGTSQINIMNPLGGFTLRFQISFVAAILVTAPIWIWNLLAFFLPALKPNERKWVVPTFFAGIALFALGNVFCYLVILAPAFEWLLGQASAIATILPDAYSYINLILMFELAFGIAFELPLVIFYLIVFKIVSYKKLRKSWRVIYVTLMVLCAFVTPDASPIPMLMLFAAMVGLYEVSLGLARLVLRKRVAAGVAVGEETDNEEEDLERDAADSKGAGRRFARRRKRG